MTFWNYVWAFVIGNCLFTLIMSLIAGIFFFIFVVLLGLTLPGL